MKEIVLLVMMLLESIMKYTTARKLRGIKFSKIKPEFPERDEIGLYVHIPFCKIPCPYCSYNRYPWRNAKAQPYINAVKKEVDIYKKTGSG